MNYLIIQDAIVSLGLATMIVLFLLIPAWGIPKIAKTLYRMWRETHPTNPTNPARGGLTPDPKLSCAAQPTSSYDQTKKKKPETCSGRKES